MHEISIVYSIVNTCNNEISSINKEKITAVYLQIGKLSGIEIPALHFAWDLATKNTALEDAEVIIEEPNGKANCSECNTLFDMEHLYDNCPNCKSPFKIIVSGKEFKIKKIILKKI